VSGRGRFDSRWRGRRKGRLDGHRARSPTWRAGLPATTKEACSFQCISLLTLLLCSESHRAKKPHRQNPSNSKVVLCCVHRPLRENQAISPQPDSEGDDESTRGGDDGALHTDVSALATATRARAWREGLRAADVPRCQQGHAGPAAAAAPTAGVRAPTRHRVRRGGGRRGGHPARAALAQPPPGEARFRSVAKTEAAPAPYPHEISAGLPRCQSGGALLLLAAKDRTQARPLLTPRPAGPSYLPSFRQADLTRCRPVDDILLGVATR
jgi:hypothetical protein